MSEVPSNWDTLRFGDIISVKYGRSLETQFRNEESQYPVVGSAGVMTKTSTPLVRNPVLVIGRKGNVGSIQFFENGCYPIDTTYYMECPEGFYLKFLEYQLIARELVKLDSSTATPSLRREDLEAISLVMPPIAEQQQIVGILEDYLSRLDAALADVKHARVKAIQFRRSLLKEVFSNNQVEAENQGSHWSNPTLGELLTPFEDGRLISQGWSPQCESEPAADDEDWGVLKTTAVQYGSFLPEYNKRLPATLDPRPSLEVQQGDLIIMRAGPRVRCGVPCLVRTTRPRLMISDKMYRFRVNSDKIDSRFLEHYLCSPDAQNLIERMKTGISDSGLNLTQSRFLNMPILLPPLNVQHGIVNKIEMIMSLMDTSLASANVVENESVALRRSLLQVAFTGQLIRKANHV